MFQIKKLLETNPQTTLKREFSISKISNSSNLLEKEALAKFGRFKKKSQAIFMPSKLWIKQKLLLKKA